MRDLCPTCLQPLPNAPRGLTARELEVVMAWWTTGSVSQAAIEVGVSQQRAKNMLAAARIRNGVKTNDQLLALNLDSIRTAVKELTSHNEGQHEAA
jgi:hypothetical protein